MSDIPANPLSVPSSAKGGANSKVVVPMPAPLLSRIDNYIAKTEDPKPTRAMAIRQLVRKGLNAKGQGKRKQGKGKLEMSPE